MYDEELLQLIGKKVIALQEMVVRDVEYDFIPPTVIKKGDVGTIVGIDKYPNGTAFEVRINNEEIFMYEISPKYWEIK